MYVWCLFSVDPTTGQICADFLDDMHSWKEFYSIPYMLLSVQVTNEFLHVFLLFSFFHSCFEVVVVVFLSCCYCSFSCTNKKTNDSQAAMVCCTHSI